MSWYERNREKALAYQREYASLHRDKYLEYQKKYYDDVLRSKRAIGWEATKQKRIQNKEMKAKEKQIKQIKQNEKENSVNNVLSVNARQPKKPRKVKYEPQFIRTEGEYILSFD